MIDKGERPCGGAWGGRWRCHRLDCHRCTVVAMGHEARRAIQEARAMPASTRWVPWSVVAEVVDRARDLPTAIGRARMGLRNRVWWARRDRRWWRSTVVRAWMAAAVADGDTTVGTAHEIETIEAMTGDRGIAVVMYGVVASSSALVDEGGVRAVLARGRAWSRISGQVEVGEPVGRNEVAATIVDQISAAWGRAYEDPEICAALACRGRGGWESLRVRISPQV